MQSYRKKKYFFFNGLVFGLVFGLGALALLGCNDGLLIETQKASRSTFALGARPTETVKLLRASRFPMSHHGVSWTSYSYTILVKSIGSSKSVSVWGENEYGEWESLEASFKAAAGAGQEVWEVHTNAGFDHFAIRYVVEEEVLWDNNGGENFTIISDGVTLFNDVDILLWNSWLWRMSDWLSLSVNLRNIENFKDVNVVYTTDGWNSTKTASLSYERNQQYGYGTAYSPNNSGIEFWQGSAFVGNAADTVEFALVYQVGDHEYWDNNFGANYVVKRH